MDSTAESIWGTLLAGGNVVAECDGHVLGIDFGSSNSCVAVWRADKNKVKVIRNSSSQAAKITPSLLQFKDGFKGYNIGSDCDESLDNVIGGLKALLLNQGKTPGDPKEEKEGHKGGSTWVDGVTVTCYDTPSDKKKNRVGKTYPVEELVGFIISYLKDCAEDYLTRRPIRKLNRIDGTEVETTTQYRADSTAEENGTAKAGAGERRVEVNRVVLGVPANFTEQCKTTLRNAAQLAGFQEVHFLVESTAAATAYGLSVAGTKNVLIFDMGGGTTDLTIMHGNDGLLSVRGTGGNNSLGGNNIDACLLDLLLEKVASLPEDQRAFVQGYNRQLLLKLCRKCKEELSTEESAVLKIPHLVAAANSKADTSTVSTSTSIDITVTRAEFEACIAPITELVQVTVFHTVQQWQAQSVAQSGSLAPAGASSSTSTASKAPVRAKEDNAGTAKQGEKEDILDEEEDTDGFVQIRSLSSDAVDKAAPSLTVPTKETESPSPTATAESATAVTAGADTTADQIGAIDEIVLVGGSSRVPAVRTAIRQAFGKLGIQRFACDGPGELCTSLNPEEVVAEGLAIRGAVLSGVSTGKLRDLLMMDCLANSIGVMSWESTGTGTGTGGSKEAENVRVFDAVLTKGMPLPASNTMRFALADRHQKFVSLDIYEEVEECKIKTTKPNASVEFEMVYTYHVIATADVSIPADLLPTADAKGRCVENRLLFDGMRSAKSAKNNGTGDSTADSAGSVDVKFTMTSKGVLKFEVTRAYDEPPDSLAAKERQFALEHQHHRTNVQTTGMLIVYAVLMLGLYLFVKMTLTEVEVAPETPVHSPVGDVDVVESVMATDGTLGAASAVVKASEAMVQAVAGAVTEAVADVVSAVCAVGNSECSLEDEGVMRGLQRSAGKYFTEAELDL